jgi:hypothetical protein
MFHVRTRITCIIAEIGAGRRPYGQRWGRRCQTVYKPGSVPRSPAAMAIPLGRTLRGASSNQPGRQRGKRLAHREADSPSLLGLAPGEVFRAMPIAGHAVRSYRTFSPLPAGPKARRRSTSLWHCLGGRPRRALPGTVFPWSPDFPRPKAERELGILAAAIRPSGIAYI